MNNYLHAIPQLAPVGAPVLPRAPNIVAGAGERLSGRARSRRALPSSPTKPTCGDSPAHCRCHHSSRHHREAAFCSVQSVWLAAVQDRQDNMDRDEALYRQRTLSQITRLQEQVQGLLGESSITQAQLWNARAAAHNARCVDAYRLNPDLPYIFGGSERQHWGLATRFLVFANRRTNQSTSTAISTSTSAFAGPVSDQLRRFDELDARKNQQP